MKIEYEATFTNIDKEEIRTRLKSIGANLVKPEFLQKRIVFRFPTGHEIKGGWLRVRDEGDKVTMSLKIVDGDKIENQKEVCLIVNDFNEAVNLLNLVGCDQKSYQETKRELWLLDEVEITIDEWPFLEPLVEIEGKSEKVVRQVAEKMGFDYAKAYFGATDMIYSAKYNISPDIINNHTERITFAGENPFVKK